MKNHIWKNLVLPICVCFIIAGFSGCMPVNTESTSSNSQPAETSSEITEKEDSSHTEESSLDENASGSEPFPPESEEPQEKDEVLLAFEAASAEWKKLEASFARNQESGEVILTIHSEPFADTFYFEPFEENVQAILNYLNSVDSYLNGTYDGPDLFIPSIA